MGKESFLGAVRSKGTCGEQEGKEPRRVRPISALDSSGKACGSKEVSREQEQERREQERSEQERREQERIEEESEQEEAWASDATLDRRPPRGKGSGSGLQPEYRRGGRRSRRGAKGGE